MAIDSQNKRASAGNLMHDVVLPVPDTTIDVYDRMQVAGLYSGIEPVSITWTTAGYPYREYLFELANHATPLFYVETMMYAVSGTAYCRLYDETDSEAVPSSEISTTDGTYSRVRSSDPVELEDGHEYRFQYGSDQGSEGKAFGGFLIQTG